MILHLQRSLLIRLNGGVQRTLVFHGPLSGVITFAALSGTT